LVSGEEEIKLKPSGEEGILLIKALCGLTRVISNVNIPNRNQQIENLPSNAIVETNAVFERDSIRPIMAGEMPENIVKLTMPHILNHEYIMEAALTFDKSLVVKAFEQDPLVKGMATKEEVEKLVEDMLDATKAYLPKEWNL